MVIQQDPNGHHFILKDDGRNLAKIKAIPGRRWNGQDKAWSVPLCRESWAQMRQLGLVDREHPAPLPPGYRVYRPAGESYLVIKTLGTPDDIARCKRIPEMRSYSTKEQAWVCKVTRNNVLYLRKNFPQLVWDGTAEHYADAALERGVASRPDIVEKAKAQRAKLVKQADTQINDYKFKTRPYEHQLTCFKMSRNLPEFALLMEMGTGKGKVIVDTAGYQFIQGNITGLLVICPNSMKEPWLEELAAHLPTDIPTDTFLWEARTRHKAEAWVLAVNPGDRRLRVLVMNVEALSGEIGAKIAELFLSKHTCLMAVDESTRIKSPSASRARRTVKLGRLARFRRILSGAPITQGPLDLFMPFKFLNPHLLGFSSYYSMRNRYALMGGWQGKQIVGYQYLDELQAKVDAASFRVLKQDCLDLPPKIYEKQVVELTPEQRALYDRIKEEAKAEIELQDGRIASTQIMEVITKVMRLQQIVGGFLTIDGEDPDAPAVKGLPVPGGNPKLDALLDIIEDQPDDQKVIIWARFRPELRLISEALRKKYGADSVVEFHGGVKNEERQVGRRAFQDATSRARFLVGQPQAGGIGTTFTAASVMVYYSNDYSLETRLQSEDRFHRIGQEAERCLIIDLMAKNTTDQRLVSALRSKKGLADLVTGDPSLSWL